MLKKLFFLFAVFLGIFLLPPVHAQNKRINLYLFYNEGCPHCTNERKFLSKIQKNYPDLLINQFEISKNKDNLNLFIQTGDAFGEKITNVPLTVICDKYISGYFNDETSGKQIEETIIGFTNAECNDKLASIITANRKMKDITVPQKKDEVIFPQFNIPLIGKMDTAQLSLPMFTFIIALLDGFNPCAMWVLIFLISLLIGLKNRHKMIILGSVFILASGFVYFLFLTAWLNFFLFLGYVIWIRIIIGIVALGSGIYYLRDYITNKSGTCKVTANEKRQKIFARLKEITMSKYFLLSIAGIILLAFAVNLVELLCSAGLPAIYTKVLSMSKLPVWQYYLYILFYIVIFMLDDMIVFSIAMITLHATGLSSKYSRLSHLLGGIIMLLIGLSLIFKPELLMFGS